MEEELHGGADIPGSLWKTCTGADFPDRICSLWKVCAGAEEECEKEGVGERNHNVLTILSPSPPCAAWKGGVGVWSEVKPERGGQNGVLMFVFLFLSTRVYFKLAIN